MAAQFTALLLAAHELLGRWWLLVVVVVVVVLLCLDAGHHNGYQDWMNQSLGSSISNSSISFYLKQNNICFSFLITWPKWFYILHSVGRILLNSAIMEGQTCKHSLHSSRLPFVCTVLHPVMGFDRARGTLICLSFHSGYDTDHLCFMISRSLFISLISLSLFQSERFISVIYKPLQLCCSGWYVYKTMFEKNNNNCN